MAQFIDGKMQPIIEPKTPLIGLSGQLPQLIAAGLCGSSKSDDQSESNDVTSNICKAPIS